MSPRSTERAGIFVLVNVLALTFFNATGTPDVQNWLDWMRQVNRFGLHDGYSNIAANYPMNYPPFSVTLLFAAARAARALDVSLFAGLKASLMLFLLATGLTLWAWTRDWLLAAALELALLPCTAALGYVDIYFALPLLLALWALERERFSLFGFCFAVAALTKYQPLVIAPFLALYLLHDGWGRRATSSLRGGLAALLIAGVGFGSALIRSFVLAFEPLNLSGNALNFWWLVTHALHSFYPEEFGGLYRGASDRIHNPIASGWSSLLIRLPFLVSYGLTLLAFARGRRDYSRLLAYSTLGFLAYFMFNLQVHENHLVLVVVLTAIAAAREPANIEPFLTWSLVANINMFVFYGLAGTGPPFSRVVGVDMAVPLAAVNVLLFALAFTRLALPFNWRSKRVAQVDAPTP